jgi:hypothetical protein
VQGRHSGKREHEVAGDNDHAHKGPLQVFGSLWRAFSHEYGITTVAEKGMTEPRLGPRVNEARTLRKSGLMILMGQIRTFLESLSLVGIPRSPIACCRLPGNVTEH